MAQTISQKILAKHAGKKDVFPGELINCKLDLVLGNDITSPPAIKEFEKIGVKKVFDKKKIYLVPDHFTPAKDIKSAEQVKMMREFAKKYGIVNFFEIGCMGVEHALLPEMGAIKPGDLIIGADSHTCTYGALGAFSTGVGSTDMAAGMATGEVWFKVPEQLKFVYRGKLPKWVEAKDLILYTIGQIGVDGARYMSMEFTGPVIDSLSVEGRMTMANMAIEAGGKNGIFPADAKTAAYLKKVKADKGIIYTSDPDAEYVQVYDWDISKIEPQVSFPHLPSNTKPVSQCKSVKIDQSVIGSCTNGRIEDLRIAAKVLKGKKKHKDVRLIIIPATQKIYAQAMKEGLFDIFLKAEAAVSTPTCGPCLGGHMGILAEGERAIATTNRNFVGRMGHPKSEVYLSNVAVAAASAVAGRIVSPEDL
ncbi:3-isopropylmalate dehydratase large subunit [candidate division WOR-1 bacterium RIFOXYA12_FULL_52_29]|uniref:3-isopropylmalate dehydratase large subunit n=1 Tax=candidate division WOR-1 bacterium RIFOXYC12_FULL_54_18 TaxID=1802584 RepID=A0A1F4T7V1_UNCSA|nr:MAG: 3-isopropylmalate dehydratase large subunit [candidate division WOR-1 bacterium RIFOXYA2_FULL_51_19]OGC18367.1 MAG: 3-isopropylmalate dehydratase large subunit [candidate division WOR-1 bacterium RIFOXYA12_FULL_52_29]OGC27222.1 MAG: 3-isopropylmalate dehydratase large subunit [candidate division WOR-1 bacterium RIFOXYB2_FULL_45_9]OGC28784.1 MAG: 3-isopropylmalate dehydratase large subunit [candidate division WOR-1 bacterium RIFOXYC12_FULL_54_18]OGC30762.1 MAG: 3-isopropylmalate dehydrat